MYRLDNGASFRFARNPHYYPSSPTGKWCFDVHPDEQEAIWDKLVDEMDRNQFSKIAGIMLGNSRMAEINNGRNKMIVFSKNTTQPEILLTLYAIRRLGIPHPMMYKTDAETMRGVCDGVGYDNYIWTSEGIQMRPLYPTEGISG